MERQFSFRARLSSVRYGFRGLRVTLCSQHNAWIHAVVTLLVIIMGCAFKIPRIEWALIILAAAAVWTAESLNTALEFLADAAIEEQHPLIGKAKDVAAGAVLISALAAILVGIIVFAPHLCIL